MLSQIRFQQSLQNTERTPINLTIVLDEHKKIISGSIKTTESGNKKETDISFNLKENGIYKFDDANHDYQIPAKGMKIKRAIAPKTPLELTAYLSEKLESNFKNHEYEIHIHVKTPDNKSTEIDYSALAKPEGYLINSQAVIAKEQAKKIAQELKEKREHAKDNHSNPKPQTPSHRRHHQ